MFDSWMKCKKLRTDSPAYVEYRAMTEAEERKARQSAVKRTIAISRRFSDDAITWSHTNAVADANGLPTGRN